jgi:hypothetical protein
MKNLVNFSVRCSHLGSCLLSPLFAGLILFFTSCTSGPEPFTILEFTGEGAVLNYSKSVLKAGYEPDSANPAAILGSIGDMFMFNAEKIFIYNDTSSKNRFYFEYDDRVLKVNGKINNISIPDDEKVIPWFEKIDEKNFSALQFIEIDSKLPESYLPYMAKLAEIKPDAGISGIDNFKDMADLLKIFKPRYIVGAELLTVDYEILSGLKNLEILAISLEDSAVYEPLPYMPELKQLFLTDIDDDIVLADFLKNNKQIGRVFIQKYGSFDFSMLKPLENLKELVVSGFDTILNLEQVNDHKNLEVLSIICNEKGDEPDFNPDLIRLPSLRWMSFGPIVTQEGFNSFVNAHPGLEIIQLIQNEKIKDLKALSKLSKLYGLIVTDTVTDIASIIKLSNLKYLSLPDDFLDGSMNKAVLQKSLPGTRIVANAPFCLGSGWLLLLIPLVLIIRFFTGSKNRGSRIG